MDGRLVLAVNPALKRVEKASQETVPVLGHLLMPVALVGYVFAFWRIAADMNWVGEFFIEHGLFSHWQVWVAVAVAIHMLASYMSRFRRADDSVLS